MHDTHRLLQDLINMLRMSVLEILVSCDNYGGAVWISFVRKFTQMLTAQLWHVVVRKQNIKLAIKQSLLSKPCIRRCCYCVFLGKSVIQEPNDIWLVIDN